MTADLPRRYDEIATGLMSLISGQPWHWPKDDGGDDRWHITDATGRHHALDDLERRTVWVRKEEVRDDA